MKKVESLVLAARSGDVEAYGAIVRQFQEMAYGYAFAILGDFHLAQDAAQEAFLEGYRNLGKLREPASFPGWLGRIVRYQCSRFTRGKRLITVPLDNAKGIPATTPDPSEMAANHEIGECITTAIRSLSPAQREIATLFYMSGYSHKDIASFLEIPVSTVKSRIHAARAQLKQRMITMVKQTLQDHRLPDDFAGRIVKGVPALAWDSSGHTTYIAAIAAAFAVTDRPFDYDSLMVYSGLAFRLRYVRTYDARDWCTVGPVGQFEEEVEAISRATGCEQSWVETRDIAEMKRRTVAAIDAGNCPTAYMMGDTGVIYGYEDNADCVLVRSYDLGEGFDRMRFEEMIEAPGGGYGPFFLDAKRDPLPPREAMIRGLRMATRNWHRGRRPGELWQSWRPAGKWEFCFGAAAYDAWIGDIADYALLTSNEERAKFCNVHSFVAYTLYDARLAASRFLTAHAALLGKSACKHLERAAGLCGELGRSIKDLREKGTAFVRPAANSRIQPDEWTPAMRDIEIQVVIRARALDAAAMIEIDEALTR